MIINSPKDRRDWKYTASSPVDDVDLRDDMMPVRNQGMQGACVAMSAAAIKEWQERKEGYYPGYLSPQFIYNLRSNIPEEGMYPRDLMRILNDIGSIPETLYPYGSDEPVTDQFKERATLYRIKGYASITDITACRNALVANGPVLLTVPVYMEGVTTPTDMWINKPGRTLVGAHAMCIVAMNKDGFILRNSWGLDWGDDGYCTFPYSDWDHKLEVWTAVDGDSPVGVIRYWWWLTLLVKRYSSCVMPIIILCLVAIVLCIKS